MTVLAAISIGVASGLILSVLGWFARPLFRRPQQAIANAFAGPAIAIEVQIRVENMSDVPVLEGPTSYTFRDIDPREILHLPSGVTGWQTWAYEEGGEDVGNSIVQVTLQGLTDDPISIEAPQLDPHRVLARTQTERFGRGGLGGGGVLPRHYTFTITGRHVERKFEDPHGRPEAFQLAMGDTERLIIKVVVDDMSRHEWGLRIPYVRRGRRRSLEVRHPNNSTFVTTGSAGLEYWNHQGQWFKS